MKRFFLLLTVLAVGTLSALDNSGWLSRARECATGGFRLEDGETPEDGVFCLVLETISRVEEKNMAVRIRQAELEARRKMVAYVHGETLSGVRQVVAATESVSSDNVTETKSFSRYSERISSKVDAFVRGMKLIGQVTVAEDTYVVCLATERLEDESLILQASQKEFGSEGVVRSFGEGATSKIAVQQAIRGAIEQVLGTVVVGYDRFNSQDGFQERIFSGVNGVVENYRILSTIEIATGVRVEVVAKVSPTKLLDSYDNYMNFLGNPAFFIASNSEDLQSLFTDFFTEMGIRITPDLQQASYVIHCIGNFQTISHPVKKEKTGTQLSLRFTITEADASEVLIDMKNKPQNATCFIHASAERQRELCAEQAFKQMCEPLHQKIQAMVGKLVGRRLDAAIEE
ncbi:MAG: LPP20 family lipoprotein [Lentisphaeria bacterium]|nr:LPP20 family lipoprotein [Lentisphaeria bacterium]